MKGKNATGILTTGALAGFVIGIFIFGFGDALREIVANQYFSYKMYRIVMVTFWEPLYKLLLISVLTALFLLVLIRSLEKLFSRLDNRSRGKVKILLLTIAWCVLFFPTAWAVNHYLLAHTKFHPVSLLADLGIFLFFVFFIWAVMKLLGKGRGKALLRSVEEKKYIKRTAAGLVILLLVLNASVYLLGKAHVPAGPNIVCIVIDALRYDHLGCSGYDRNTSPTMDGLANEGILFKHAHTSAPWTKPAVASLFSSLYPNHHQAINLRGAIPEEIPVMSEILKNEGYRTLFFCGKNNFIGRGFNFHQGFDYYLNRYLNAEQLTDKALEVIEKMKDKRFFAYIHYMDVHLPYNKNKFNYRFTPRREGTRFAPGKFQHKNVKGAMLRHQLSPEDKEYIIALYDGQVRFVDENIKIIVSRLKEKGIFKNTLLVITSDHGEEFWDHRNFEHGHSMYHELVNVPLIMVGSMLKKAVEETPVKLIDLLPAVLRIARIKSGKYGLEGTGLPGNFMGKKNNPQTPIFVMNTIYGPEKYGVIHGGRKLIFNTKNKTKDKVRFEGFPVKDEFELYDIAGDPLETKNLVGLESENENLSQLKGMLNEFINKKIMFKGKQVKIDKKTKDELKSLGYF